MKTGYEVGEQVHHIKKGQEFKEIIKSHSSLIKNNTYEAACWLAILCFIAGAAVFEHSMSQRHIQSRKIYPGSRKRVLYSGHNISENTNISSLL